MKLVRNSKSSAVEKDQQFRSSFKQRILEWVRRREIYAQDKFAGVVEMAREIKSGERQFITPEFIMHINELTLLTQGAGPGGIALKPSTTFAPLGPIPGGQEVVKDYRSAARPALLERLLSR